MYPASKTTTTPSQGFVNARTGKPWPTAEPTNERALRDIHDQLAAIADLLDRALDRIEQHIPDIDLEYADTEEEDTDDSDVEEA